MKRLQPRQRAVLRPVGLALGRAGIGFAAIIGSLGLASGQASADKLSFERLHADPPLTGTVPRGIEVAPDGARVTWLQPRADNQDVLDLWQIERAGAEPALLLRQEDLVAGPVALTDEEIARRQRLRIRAGGITSYAYDDTGQRLLIPLAGSLYVYDFESGNVSAIDDGAARSSPKLAPTGDAVAFVRNRNLWIRELESGNEVALTDTGSETVVNGLAEFIAQEEMGRVDGFWWSPDGRRIAFVEYDESNVTLLERVAINGDGTTLSEQRYPLAGTDNVTVRVGIVDLDGRRTVWADLGDEADIYLARVGWSEDGSRVYLQRQPRSQGQLDLLAVSPTNGSAHVLVSDSAADWINLHDDLRPLPDGRFLWSSEQTGFRHLYLHAADGRELRALTSGDWLVDEIACVDADTGQVYFTGWIDDPLTANLYRVAIDASGPPERISRRDGYHSIAAAADCSLYVDTFSAPDRPPQVSLHDRSGERVAWLFENELDADHPYAPFLDTHVLPEFGTLGTDDGATLYYSIHKPADFDPARRYPAVVRVYGGPGSQTVRRSFGSLTVQALADAGYVVFALDNRGSSRRGVAFEAPISDDMGAIEVRDQLAGIRLLASQPYVDADRIGVSGWSYGGYMALMLLAKGGDRIAAAVAGAPVTDWRLYDTHYTERYLGLPDDGRDVYQRTSVFPYLEGISGPLLLIHGMADDNVFFTNSTRLMQSLQRANVPFELMTYPGETHFISDRGARLHSDMTTLRFLNRHLKPAVAAAP